MCAVNMALLVLGPSELSLVGIENQQHKNMSPPSQLPVGHAIMLCALAIAAPAATGRRIGHAAWLPERRGGDPAVHGGYGHAAISRLGTEGPGPVVPRGDAGRAGRSPRARPRPRRLAALA